MPIRQTGSGQRPGARALDNREIPPETAERLHALREAQRRAGGHLRGRPERRENLFGPKGEAMLANKPADPVA
jgi:hypothetical protein